MGSPISPARARPHAENCATKWARESDDFVILSMARLAPDKGLEYLIEAASILPRTGRRLQFVIAGDGPHRDHLERLAATLGVSDRVKFLGFREDVADLLAASDLIALPSLREGLSIALLEAMAAARPIVATSIGSQREVAAHAEMALLVPPADALALSQAILHLVADPATQGAPRRQCTRRLRVPLHRSQNAPLLPPALPRSGTRQVCAMIAPPPRGARQPAAPSQESPVLVPASHQSEGDSV